MEGYNNWFNRFSLSEQYKKLAANPVAYFCMEYALPGNLPIYAGGLGVLAGDYVTEAKIQKFPMVAIGLLYARKSYFDKFDNILVTNGYIEAGLRPVVDKFGNKIIVKIPMLGRELSIQAWVYDKDTIPVYLLDTNIVDNLPDDRTILDLLYVGDPATRLKQEIILGIGGVRLLGALDITPSIYHMNEGHSALLTYELCHNIMTEEKCDFEKAFATAKKKLAFTNHTLVKGGHDAFDDQLTTSLLHDYAEEIKIDPKVMIKKGFGENDDNQFSMTDLAIQSATKVNAVSVLHAEVAKEVWENAGMIPITNGVNLPRWDRIENEGDIDKKHKENKKKLLELILKKTGVTWGEDDLIIGWARRIVGYKRPTALFEDIEQIKKILQNKNKPVRLLYAGYPHYSDKEGHWFLNQIRDLAKGELKGSLVYLENYSTDISSLMVAGSDIWLNTPIVGLEACGTSGMKAALNGTILCSTNDGWLPEVDLQKVGFMLDNDYISVSTRDVLANIIAPIYYDKDQHNTFWLQKMQQSRKMIVENFGTDRMLKDYIEQIYLPLLENNK